MEFERLERELFCLLNAASKKKQQYDRACSACHLLLRPWPKKSSKKVDIGEAGQGDVKNCVSGNEPDPKEVAELKVVNDVLSKALKARKKMSPKELTREQDVANVETENSSASIQENVNSNPTLGNEIWEVCDSDSADDSARNASSKSKTGPVCKPIKTPVNPESARRNKTLHAGEEGTGCHDNEVRNLNGSQSSRTGSSKGQLTGSRSNVSRTGVDVQRSKSSTSAQSFHISDARPRSSQGKVKPAHVSAPFKTQPNMPVPKRQIMKYGASAVQNRSKKSTSLLTYNRGHSKVLPPINRDCPKVQNCASTVPSNFCTEPDSGESGELCLESMKNGVCDEEIKSANALAAGVSELALCNRTETGQTKPVPTSNPVQQQEDKAKGDKCLTDDCFSLQANGSSMNIPSNVRRGFVKNQQLRRKLQQKTLQRKPVSQGSEMGRNFISKLEESFDCDQELVYRQQAWWCLHAHNRLAETMKELKLHQLTDLWSPEDVLHAKLVVEFILSSFSALAEEADVLTRIQFQQTGDVMPDCGAPEPDHQHHVWFPADNGIPLCLASKLCYTSIQQLHQYCSLQLKVQNLQYQLHLMRLLTSDFLPVLEKHLPQSDSTFRGIFSLAVSCGEHSPALVHGSS